MISDHLGTDRLYDELRSEIEDMNRYLDSDALRRQGDTMVRLTVVATIGLIGVATTGILGMNIFAAADEPAMTRVLYFLLALIPTAGMTFFIVLRSRRLSDFFETLADEQMPAKEKLAAFVKVWSATRWHSGG
jgi:hypothetical protein